MSEKNLVFEAIKNRHATRKYQSKTVSDQLLIELLELANSAPSGFNLQPWSFLIVRNNDLKKLLRIVAMNQPQVEDAPVVLIFIADPQCWKNTYPEIIRHAVDAKYIDRARAEKYLKSVNAFFRTGPLGIFGFLKKLIVPILRLFKPLPRVITSYEEASAYVRAQTMLAAGTFMIAAKSVGLDTCPMEGFDEERLKKLLSIPSNRTIPLIITVGYADKEASPSFRLPLEKITSIDSYLNKVVRVKKAS